LTQVKIFIKEDIIKQGDFAELYGDFVSNKKGDLHRIQGHLFSLLLNIEGKIY